MGISSEVFAFAGKCSPGAIRQLEHKFYFPKLSRPGIVLIDGPGLLQFRTSSAVQGYAHTIGDLVIQFQSRLSAYLSKEQVAAVIFYFDVATPEPKVLDPKRSGRVPTTPTAIPNPTMEQGMAAWAAKLAADIVPFHDSSVERLADPSLPVSQAEMNYQLPRSQKEIAESGCTEEFSYEECMRNRHFKRLLYDIVLRRLLGGLYIPPDKWVLACGPKHCLLADSNGEVIPRPELVPQANEADSILGYYASLFTDFDIVVDSPDGDIINTMVMGSWPRIEPSKGELRFFNKVLILRNQWNPRNSNSMVDINQLFAFYNQFSPLCATKYSINVSNPIMVWTAINILAGGADYVEKSALPNIGPASAFRALMTYCDAFADLCQPHLDSNGYHHIILNPDAFGRLVVACYRVRGNPELSWNLSDALETLRSKTQTASVPSTVDGVYVVCANISWTLSYFSAASFGCVPPDPFETRHGLSVWGYTKENDTVQRATRVHTEYLRWRSQNLCSVPAQLLEFRL